MTPGLPSCLVEVRWGRLAGTKIPILAGRSLRVGRTDRADLVVAHDGKMSNVHFELSWDGKRCTLRDQGSLTGTKLGGAPVTSSEVPHGAWIQAGETDFMVYYEGHTGLRTAEDQDDDDDQDDEDEDEDSPAESDPPSARAASPDAASRDDTAPSEYTLLDADRLTAARGALAHLRDLASREPLYTILDAARDDRILELLREHKEPHRSLYEGAEGEALDDVAPYLAGPMLPDSALLDRLVLEGWGRRWGIYVASREPLRELRRHFRRFLMVEVEDTGERVYFRFMDPDVLVPFFEVATPDQRQQLTAMASHIAAEHHDRALEVHHVHP